MAIEEFLQKEDLVLKENWTLFKIDSRPLDFLGYRFYRGYTTLRKGNFLRIKRQIKKIYKKANLNYLDSCAVISYLGWVKHSNSYNYKRIYMEPYIDVNACKETIRNDTRKLEL